MQSKATTVKKYLAELPADRRLAMQAVRKVILDNIDPDYEEGMQYGMIGYYVPHRIFPAGYHCDPKQPLPFVCLASQKNHMSLYLWSAYGDGQDGRWLREQWAKTGKKLDMGQCCIRFRKLDDIPLAVIGEAIRRVPVQRHLDHYQGVLRDLEVQKAARKQSGAKKAAKKTVKKAPAASKLKAAKKTAKKVARKAAKRRPSR